MSLVLEFTICEILMCELKRVLHGFIVKSWIYVLNMRYPLRKITVKYKVSKWKSEKKMKIKWKKYLHESETLLTDYSYVPVVTNATSLSPWVEVSKLDDHLSLHFYWGYLFLQSSLSHWFILGFKCIKKMEVTLEMLKKKFIQRRNW